MWMSTDQLCLLTGPTLILLGRIVVVDLLPDPFSFAQVPSQVFLLLLVVMAQEFFPVVRVHVLLLLDDLPLHLLLNMETCKACEEDGTHVTNDTK